MSISTTIIGILLLALFIVPVIIISRTGRNKGKALLKELHSQAQTNGLEIGENDFWNDSVLGFDTGKGKVIYLSAADGRIKQLIFGLDEVRTITTIPDLSGRKRQDDIYKNGKKLGLVFSFTDKSRPDLEINFYVPGFGKMTESERQLFEKWAGIFSARLKTS